MSPDNPYYISYWILLRIGHPLLAVIVHAIVATRFLSETGYEKDAKNLYRGAIAFIITLVSLLFGAVLLGPLLSLHFRDLLILLFAVVCFLIFQLASLLESGVARGLVSFAIFTWVSVLVNWGLYLASW